MTDNPTQAALVERLEQFAQWQETANRHYSNAELARIAKDALTTQAARIKVLEEALRLAHFYIDASDMELREKGWTRSDALFYAREQRDLAEIST